MISHYGYTSFLHHNTYCVSHLGITSHESQMNKWTIFYFECIFPQTLHIKLQLGIMPVSQKKVQITKKFIVGGMFICMLSYDCMSIRLQSFVSKCIWIKNPKLVFMLVSSSQLIKMKLVFWIITFVTTNTTLLVLHSNMPH